MDLLNKFTEITIIMEKIQKMGLLSLEEASILFVNGRILTEHLKTCNKTDNGEKNASKQFLNAYDIYNVTTKMPFLNDNISGFTDKKEEKEENVSKQFSNKLKYNCSVTTKTDNGKDNVSKQFSNEFKYIKYNCNVTTKTDNEEDISKQFPNAYDNNVTTKISYLDDNIAGFTNKKDKKDKKEENIKGYYNYLQNMFNR